MDHKKEIEGYSSLNELAREIADLRYDALADFLGSLATKIMFDAHADQERGRQRLATELLESYKAICHAEKHIKEAWTIAQPYMESVVLYRPVGKFEMELISKSGYQAFPPRLFHQPIFYPVLNEEYATQIARDWNTKDESSGYCGFVLKFNIHKYFLDKYEKHIVGSSHHQEYWIPAEDLDLFNKNIDGKITVVSSFIGEKENTDHAGI